MEVNIANLQKLFAKPVRYEIPLFQRPYVWNEEQQWAPLWEDVQNATERFDPGAKPTDHPRHFIGAVVLQQQQMPTPMLETRLVVDGQQRLTTLQLLLSAVQVVFKERGDERAAKRLDSLVSNPDEYRDDADYEFKVWPTRADQEAFRHAMRDGLSADGENSLIISAREFFKNHVRDWLDRYPIEDKQKTQALEQVIRNLLELVVIDLGDADDPHVIFETLNARGTPLLQSDLIKNIVLYEFGNAADADSTPQDANPWDFNGSWWREEVRQGRLVRPRIDVFLNYWLVMRTRTEVVATDVFSVFRRYSATRDIHDVAADIGKVREAYYALEKDPATDMKAFLYRREVMQSGVLTPVLLWLLSEGVPREQIKKGLRALESHQLRRMVCRFTTRGYNRLFISLVDKLVERGPECAGDTVVEYLREQDSYVGLWPNDQQMKDAFLGEPLYRLLTRGRLRMVLEGIEEDLRTSKAESRDVPRDLTIGCRSQNERFCGL